MNMRGWLLGGLAAILATACSHRIVPPPPSVPLVTSPSSTPEAPVPLPAQTPYDGKAQARALYLENYVRGYSIATSDYASPGCLCTAEGDPELYEAAINGFNAGRETPARPHGPGNSGRHRWRAHRLPALRRQNRRPLKSSNVPLEPARSPWKHSLSGSPMR